MNFLDLINNSIGFFQNQILLVKVGLTLVIIVFSFFTVIMARQISILTELVNQVTFSPIFKLTAYVLVGVTFLILLLVILV